MAIALIAGVAVVPTAATPLGVLDSCFVVETAGGSVGTGFLLEGDLIATAAHVVGDESRVTLRSPEPDSRVVEGAVIHVDSQADVAVIAPDDPTALEPLPVEATLPELGSTAFAIGSPIRGLVLSRGEVLGSEDGLIRTNTPVDPGNSGGPLVDDSGVVRGLVVSKDAITGNAYSVPIGVVMGVVDVARDKPRPARSLASSPGAAPSSLVPNALLLSAVGIAVVLLATLIVLAFILRVGPARPRRLVITLDEEK